MSPHHVKCFMSCFKRQAISIPFLGRAQSEAANALRCILNEELKNMKENYSWKQEHVLTCRQGAQVTIEGQCSKILNFSNSNYLGFASNQEIGCVAKMAIDNFGSGIASSRFVSGTQCTHKELEGKIAKFHCRDAAILYSNCYMANAGFFEAVLTDRDYLFYDELSHQSMVDGIRLCCAQKCPFRHNDMCDLEQKLKGVTCARLKMIATCGVFPQEGEYANLPDICKIAQKYCALMYVDDAHATGCVGRTGRGTEELCGIMGAVDILTSTFGNAVGGATGGYTTGLNELICFLRQTSKTYLFTNSVPAASVAAGSKAIDLVISNGCPLIQCLQQKAEKFRCGLQRAGFQLGGQGHPIIPVMLCDARIAHEMAAGLLCLITIGIPETNPLHIIMNLYRTIFLCILMVPARRCKLEAYIDFMSPSVGPLRHFWDSTGFSPSTPSDAQSFLLSYAEKLNLALIAALPNSAIRHARIHWMLDLIDYRNSEYDFSLLDHFIGWLQKFGISPGFELMGNPGHLFNDFENATQVQMWQELTQKVIERYVGQYGLETVSRWRFETWNEPDLKMYNTLNFTISGYLNYFSATTEGISRAVGQKIQVGAPAGLFKTESHHPLCWGLLRHCNIKECPLSFLSFHRKGNNTANLVTKGSVALIEDLREKFPRLSKIPLANDEADPLSGWWKDEEWRSDVRYAAMVTHIISKFQTEVIDELKLPLSFISNDNGFLSSQPHSFTQRSLLARFQMNATTPPHQQFFQKPVYAAMGLLSLLGNAEMSSRLSEPDEKFLLLASTDYEPQWSASVLITYSDDITTEPLTLKNLTLIIKNVPYNEDSKIMYVIYILNNLETNPYQIWKDAKFPSSPDYELRRQMRNAEGPKRLQLETVSSRKSQKIFIPLALPTVAVLFFCSSEHNSPSFGKATSLKTFNITFNEVLLTWSDKEITTRCIKTYEIEFMHISRENNDTSEFRRINTKDSIFLSFHFAPLQDPQKGYEEVRGLYRVRIVDFWQRTGPYSNVVEYPKSRTYKR